MDANYTCDIIRDLIPGYVDGILSEAGTNMVKVHLERCEECRCFYEELRTSMEMSLGASEEELLVLDGFKKIQKRTRRLKLKVGVVSCILLIFVLAVFLRVFIIGEPLETGHIQVSDVIYDEDAESLAIEGTLTCSGFRVSRVVCKPSKENVNEVNVIVYAAETFPFFHEDNRFSVEIPNMKGRKAYLAYPEYDRREVFSWKTYHYELLAQLEEEIHQRILGWDEKRDILQYGGGITTVDGLEGISYDVTYVVGEEASYWRFNDQIITDGDFVSADFEIWISLKEPYQIKIYDYKTGDWSQDYSTVTRRRPKN